MHCFDHGKQFKEGFYCHKLHFSLLHSNIDVAVIDNVGQIVVILVVCCCS